MAKKFSHRKILAQEIKSYYAMSYTFVIINWCQSRVLVRKIK